MLPWHQLVRLSDAELSGHELAAINLACAAGLPGAEDLDVRLCLAVLDTWAERVGKETVRASPQFRKEPLAFEDSWAYFRVLVLATVLQEDFGVGYNAGLVERDDFFSDAANLFLHGVLQGKGGTCSSLPLVYVAVGRRLGYPLRLVQTKGHVFARWDDPEAAERFNVECTSRGLVCHPDAYYRGWPSRTTVEEEQYFGWLVSLTPREELAGFLINRGHCWLDNGHCREATEAYAWACAITSRHRGYEGCVALGLQQWREQLGEPVPLPLPRRTSHSHERRFPGLSLELEREIIHLEVIDDLQDPVTVPYPTGSAAPIVRAGE